VAGEQRGDARGIEGVDVREVEQHRPGRPPHDGGAHRTGDLVGVLVGDDAADLDDHRVVRV
jgi:hypothetical protein